MTLDEGIILALEKVGDCETECEKNYAQLAHWLQSYKDMLNDDSKSKMTKYDLEKMAYSTAPPLNYEEIARYKPKFKNLFLKGKYFMLMCKERSYFTLFDIKENCSAAAQELINILFNMSIKGDIVDIEENDSTSFKIWIRYGDNEVYMYMLFLYDEGVIEC